jgi:hypothetical protein
MAGKGFAKSSCERKVLIPINELITEENHLPLQESSPDLGGNRRIKRLCQIDTKDFGTGVASHRSNIETEFGCA